MKVIPIRKIATANKIMTDTGRFSIRDVQQVLQGNDLVHDLHKHDFFFVLALEKAAGFHEIDFLKYPVHNHSVFILRPGQVHRLELKSGCKGFLMEFDLTFYQPKKNITDLRWQKASSKNYCEVEAKRFMKLQAVLANILHEFTSKEEGYIEAIKANLDIFFIEYIRQSQNPKSIAKKENIYAQERFEEFLSLVEKYITTHKQTSHYTQLMNLSPYQLNEITKSSVGKTASDIINEQIILEAKRYLIATPNQVKDIADQLGYEDPSYFIRFFKKHTGHSPEAFRQHFK
jgi:AraC-like DNA-binding protein